MATRSLILRRGLQRSPLSVLLKLSSQARTQPPPLSSICIPNPSLSRCFSAFSRNPWPRRSFSQASVNLVLSGGKPRFEVNEPDLPKKEKWLTKKRLKLQRKREKRKRREANKTDPRRIQPKGLKMKQRFPNAEARIKYKIEKAKLKEAMLVEKLTKYEVPKAQGPLPKPDILTGEERFFLKKMAQKKSNYVPVGRRGVFGGVILNMHLHWKKHETVKVICKPCKPGQIQEYATEIARLSGGIPIHIIGDTIVFYRGKNYIQPEVMSPIDTLSKKKALAKSKYEQSLETVRRFIAISEKELELYYRHVALYGDPNTRNSDLLYASQTKVPYSQKTKSPERIEAKSDWSVDNNLSTTTSDSEIDFDDISESESDCRSEELSKTALVSEDGEDMLNTPKCTI